MPIVRKLGFGAIDDSLSLIPELSLGSLGDTTSVNTSSSSPSTSTSSPSTSSSSPGVNWTQLGTSFFQATGSVLSSALGPHPSTVPATPGLTGTTLGASQSGGTINSNLLLIGGVAIVAILMLSKKSAA